MKKLTATICILGTVLGLAACSSTGTVDSDAPYATERTAGHGSDAAPAHRTFKSGQNK